MTLTKEPHLPFFRVLGKRSLVIGFCALLFLILAGSQLPVVWQAVASALRAEDPEMFGIYTCALDGTNLKRVLADPTREMNHARVSPDRAWITFTRYNKRGLTGLAEETNGYDESEIMLVRPDGSGLRSLVPPAKDIFAANGYWTPDGKFILYVSKLPGKKSEISRIDLATGQIVRIPAPTQLWASDPHPVGSQMTFACLDAGKSKRNTIWIMNGDGTQPKQVTGKSSSSGAQAANEYPSDYDPKLSPDGSRIAVMRRMGPDNWHVVITDLKSGGEQDLSGPQAVDGVPEWSGDGKLLIFWHVNPKNLRSSGLYTMQPDGSDRKRVPLPSGYFYTMPAFFPGEGSDRNARIVFSAKKNPAL
jgi:Tol biopolymer transport system component